MNLVALWHMEEAHGESKDGRAWWAAIYGVTQSWTQLKRLSSSSSIHDTLILLEEPTGELIEI